MVNAVLFSFKRGQSYIKTDVFLIVNLNKFTNIFNDGKSFIHNYLRKRYRKNKLFKFPMILGLQHKNSIYLAAETAPTSFPSIAFSISISIALRASAIPFRYTAVSNLRHLVSTTKN